MKPGIYEISERFLDGRVYTRRVIVPQPVMALPSRQTVEIPSYIWWCAGIFCFLTLFFGMMG